MPNGCPPLLPIRINSHHHCASTATTLCVNGKPRDGAIHQVSFVFCIFVSTQRDTHQHQHSSPSASIGHIQYDPRPHATHPQARVHPVLVSTYFLFSLYTHPRPPSLQLPPSTSSYNVSAHNNAFASACPHFT